MEKDCLRIERNLGVPQGGVISPILSNLFLHYAFDLWMGRAHPDLPWCRYADDGLVHCRSEQEAETLKVELQARFAECGLEMHPTKTKIAYCKDSRRKGSYPNVTFDFLGYCFRPRQVRNPRSASVFCGFNPAVSPSALKSMRETIRELDLRRSNACVDGRHRRTAQSIPSRMDRVLRSIHALGPCSLVSLCQSNHTSLGSSEIPALCSRHSGHSLSTATCSDES